jgi:hypothetical protein
MAVSTNFSRPHYDRQRSYSAPEFAALDVTASEAIIICSAAAQASDRRRGRRRDPRYVSLDVDTERSLSRTVHGAGDSDADDERDAHGDTRRSRKRAAKITSLNNYSQNMAVFVQQRIEAIQRGETRPSTPPTISLPDSLLCPSPPGESEDEEITETLRLSQSSTQDLDWLRPPLRSVFSAWSSAATTPDQVEPASVDEQRPITSFFDFPEPPHITADGHSSRLEEDGSALDEALPSDRRNDGTIIEHPNISLDEMCTPRRARHQHSVSDQLAVRTKNSFLDVSPAAFSTPIALYAQYFPPRTAKLIEPRTISVISPFDGAPISRIHHIKVTSPHHYLIEGQMFELCH